MYDQSAGGVVDVVKQGYCRLTDGSGNISADDRIASHGGTGEEGEVDSGASGDHVFGVARFAGQGDGNDVEAYVDFTQSEHSLGGAP